MGQIVGLIGRRSNGSIRRTNGPQDYRAAPGLRGYVAFGQEQNNPDRDVATEPFPHRVLGRNVVSTKRYYKNIVFWITQTFHNALWLFQRYPHSEFCFLAILLFTEPIVVIIFAQWPFSRIAPNIYRVSRELCQILGEMKEYVILSRKSSIHICIFRLT